MTASQQPDAEHAPLTSPAAAGSGSTGHDKAVEIVREIGRFHRPASLSVVCGSLTCQCGVESTDPDGLERHRAELSVAALRAALAAGDPDVAQALDVPSLLAAAKAQALRDAAGAIEPTTCAVNRTCHEADAITLRIRADRIEAP